MSIQKLSESVRNAEKLKKIAHQMLSSGKAQLDPSVAKGLSALNKELELSKGVLRGRIRG